MSGSLRIDLDWLNGPQRDPVEQSTFAQIAIAINDQTATELEDLFAQTVRTNMLASAYDLAIWFVANWWRLRWEPEGNTIDWRLSHALAAAGGGFAWPDLSFASDGVHVLIHARPTGKERGAPVRYLRALNEHIKANDFEAGVDDFVNRVVARLSAVGVSGNVLPELWQELLEERADPEIGARRKLEALLGFDAGDAPDELIKSLNESAMITGQEATDEIAAANKADALATIEELMPLAQAADNVMRCDVISGIADRSRAVASVEQLPWKHAEVVARIARESWAVGSGPVANAQLSSILGLPEELLNRTAESGAPMAAGLRSELDGNDVRIVLRSKNRAGRRFELMRLVADHCLAPKSDRLLPATSAKTHRQKFQRAFAQEFLFPSAELMETLGPSTPSDEEIESVAERYDVSPLMVRTTLVNRGHMPREALEATSS